jgi:hypothetical protein|tara:strand:- start:404 stop:571 length:168 start_codon:yes stop_codon:yes gene_type:complete
MPTRSKSTQAFIDANPDKFRIITPEETAKTLAKQSGGYFKGRSVMGPSKKKGKSS